jgi:hypothetical protein
VAVREATDRGIEHGGRRRRQQEDPTHGRIAPAEPREPERAENGDRPEQESGERDQQGGPEEAPTRERIAERPQRERLPRPGRQQGRPDRQPESGRAEGDEHRCDPDEGCQRPERGAKERAGKRTGDGDADDLPAACFRRERDEPGEAAGPRERRPATLDEARGEDGRSVRGEAEGDARRAEEDDAADRGRLHPDPSRQQTARHRADQRAGRVRRHERARRGLGE